jgi:ubiquinone/menaquinone biosynthesis C-methylase UbiE
MINVGKDYVRFAWQLAAGWRVRHEHWIAELRCSDLSVFQNNEASLKILDLANGALRPQYKILKGQGHQVFGIDMVNYPQCDWKSRVYKLARALYAWNLKAKYPMFDDSLVCGDVSKLPFREQSLDLVTSVAAFEHFLDVPSVLKEVHRVLKPGGFAWVLVHPFSSLSGGHNVSLSEVPLRAIPRGIDPWDHLRKRRLSFHVPLNEWRRDRYLEEFRRYFKVVKHYCALREGENIITSEIESELSDYSRDELTCGAYVIVVSKPS